jgi:hypothetical protein
LRWLNSFLRLSRGKRRLFIQSVFLVAAVRLGLWLLPFGIVRQLLRRATQPPALSSERNPAIIDQIAWAVTRASLFVPVSTCLTQALAAQILLRWHGLPARVHMGVAKDAHNCLVAHAWTESGGRVVVGGSGLGRYTPLLVLENEHP